MRLAAVLWAVLLFSATLAGCGGDRSPAGGSPATEGDPPLEKLTIHAGREEVRVRVEIADEPAEQQRGLMYRTALGEDRGMLFVFDRERRLSFWMRNTLIPLSIAYIDSEGRIVDIQDMKPLDDAPPHYVSAEPAMYALEVNRGFFEEHEVDVGDTVELP